MKKFNTKWWYAIIPTLAVLLTFISACFLTGNWDLSAMKEQTRYAVFAYCLLMTGFGFLLAADLNGKVKL